MFAVGSAGYAIGMIEPTRARTAGQVDPSPTSQRSVVIRAEGDGMADITIIDDGTRIESRRFGRVFGWFFLATFLTSIPRTSSVTRRCWTTRA